MPGCELCETLDENCDQCPLGKHPIGMLCGETFTAWQNVYYDALHARPACTTEEAANHPEVIAAAVAMRDELIAHLVADRLELEAL